MFFECYPVPPNRENAMYSLIERLASQVPILLNQQGTNATTFDTVLTKAANTTSSFGSGELSQLSQLATLWNILSTLGIAKDWVKLFALGTVLETVRRFAGSLWTSILDSFFLTATFESTDDAYSWLMIWVSRQPIWDKARDVHVSTQSWGITVSDFTTRGIAVPGEGGDDTGARRSLHFLPSFGLSQSFWYKYHWMRVTRSRRALSDTDTTETLTIRILTRSQKVLYQLLAEAKQMYEKEEQYRVSIYTAGSYHGWSHNNWFRTGSRPKRPLESVVLDDGLKEMVLQDCQEFMASEKWYSERGLPWRRGFLLHGCPGSGKTSLVHAIAGELNLDIYIINLGKRGLDDTGLSELVSELPARSVALIEEIDAAFLRGVSRDSSGDNSNASKDGDSKGVTLSGLLSSIDGIQASEGRLLFATTNNYHALDPALVRAGRLDVHIEFTAATKKQVEELFKRFFRVSEVDESQDGRPDPSAKEKEKGSAPSNGDGTGKQSRYSYPVPEKLTRTERDELATRFANAIPEREFAMSSIQGLLLQHKHRPSRVLEEVEPWMEKERKAKREREKALRAAEEKRNLAAGATILPYSPLSLAGSLDTQEDDKRLQQQQLHQQQPSPPPELQDEKDAAA
ncbi:hypothetical protein FRC14_006263 [Serendipita sp. 396]|nr:hypothetical protein FRC14_006263 [Serendipita sp. 396]KAG8789627.1 hypothetical protein FRC15_006359 [Serendipita sp. 397]KAG8804421.1 hypothetical protein FRC16_008943 [Serendipita sp. 398]KAG8878102.1 hypothetical protein FRC20_009387 [Serendipita sp. 405]